jgi:beta-lactamase class A
MQKYLYILLGIIVCLAGEFAAYKLNHKYEFVPVLFARVQRQSYDEMHEGGGKFTNPLLECLGVQETDSLPQFHISDPDLTAFVSAEISKHKLADMSVYLRDLNDGPWIGVNSDDDFIGGSLLKVPMLISYLKLAESDPALLGKEVEYGQQLTSNVQYFSPSKQIEPGNTYTIEELLEYMIEYSDNNAAELLFQNIDPGEFDKVFAAMGLGDPDPNNPYDVNTKTYAGFFRILFNASYLTKADSEKALAMLSRSEFDKGIQAGLPGSITVSHKFGIRSDGGVNQFHDCGIVYYPGRPYLLCVMSRGGSFDGMSASVGEVSKYVYDQITTGEND